MEHISFGTDGWRARLDTFTTPRVRMVGQAVATWLRDEGFEDPVAIGYDARETSRGFAEELTRVVCANGFDVVFPERDCPTPLVAHAIVERELSGALVVTASHNPPEYNGVKVIPADGAPALPEVMDAIGERLAEPDPLPEADHGTARVVDLQLPHADACIDLANRLVGTGDVSLSGQTVAYDAMHGSGRGVTDDLLERAGATVERHRCQRDPTFGGGSPEPTAETLTALSSAVVNGDADLGIANDGDADRLAVVTPGRGSLDENLFFAALYDFLLERRSGPAVRSVSTTYLIDRVAEAHDEDVIEVPVGFKWVAKAMVDHDALVGGEESGGFTVRGHVREKDGVLLALLAAAMHAEESLDERVDRLLETHGAVVQDKTSVPCPDERKAGALAELEADAPEKIAGEPIEDVNSADGLKLLLADGSWLLVRPSGTEPKLRIYAEAESEPRVEALLDAGRELIE